MTFRAVVALDASFRLLSRFGTGGSEVTRRKSRPNIGLFDDL